MDFVRQLRHKKLIECLAELALTIEESAGTMYIKYKYSYAHLLTSKCDFMRHKLFNFLCNANFHLQVNINVKLARLKKTERANKLPDYLFLMC